MEAKRTVQPKGTTGFKLLVFPIIYIFASLPFFITQSLGNVVYFILYKIVKYRVKVVKENLRNAFPQKSDKERLEIEIKYYKHLSDLFFETLKGLTVSKNQLKQRMKNVNQSVYDDFYSKGQSFIVVMSHCGNWEWVCDMSQIECKQQVQCVYKTLSSKGFDWLMYKIRSRFGAIPMSMEQTLRVMTTNKSVLTVTAFIGDQNPSSGKNAHWSYILNQDTPFMNGPEKISKMFNYPIVYLSSTKTKRGHYLAHSEILIEDPSQYGDGEITEIIAKRTEKEILAQPEIWLWSHRRWKHKKEK
jgi:KDO2-lipid IV(A) lauroyltransferase